LARSDRTAARRRSDVVPDDIKALAGPVLAHRLVLTPEASMQSADARDVVDDLLRKVPVPTARER
jgi:MoxR-like ATPase